MTVSLTENLYSLENWVVLDANHDEYYNNIIVTKSAQAVLSAASSAVSNDIHDLSRSPRAALTLIALEVTLQLYCMYCTMGQSIQLTQLTTCMHAHPQYYHKKLSVVGSRLPMVEHWQLIGATIEEPYK